MRQSIIRKRAREKDKANKIKIARLHRQNRGLHRQGEAGAGLPNKLAGLRGGAKHMLLKQNRDEVLEYMAKNGRVATMFHYNIYYPDTLDVLAQQRGKDEPPITSLDIMCVKNLADKALAQADQAKDMSLIDREGQRAITLRMDKLEADYAQFTQAVAQSLDNKYEQVIALGLQQIIKLPAGLEVGDKPDKLSLNTLLGLPEFTTRLGTHSDQVSVGKGHRKVRNIMERTLNPFAEKT